MNTSWKNIKNLLCIRLDNMGDLLMSSPAIHALKRSFGCNITLLTSSMAAGIAPHIGYFDQVIISDVPWVKGEEQSGATEYLQLSGRLRSMHFDAAVVFTTFSQNPMPSIMLAYLAEIPLRLAYCRENPYQLLTDWIPEEEPYTFIRHQVTRDLDLVSNVGASIKNERLILNVPHNAYAAMTEKIKTGGIAINKPWIVVHPCASEKKREYPPGKMCEILRSLIAHDIQVIVTGTAKEKPFTDKLCSELWPAAFSAAGVLKLEEFMALIDLAPLLLSVNSGPVHIAAALNTPVVVLYAMTNPQHTPWMVLNKVFYFPVQEKLKSQNQILKYLDTHVYEKDIKLPEPEEVVKGIMKLLRTARQPPVSQLKNQEFPSSRQ